MLEHSFVYLKEWLIGLVTEFLMQSAPFQHVECHGYIETFAAGIRSASTSCG